MKKLKFLLGRVPVPARWAVGACGWIAVTVVSALVAKPYYAETCATWRRDCVGFGWFNTPPYWWLCLLIIPLTCATALLIAYGVNGWAKKQLTDYEDPPEPQKPGVEPDPWGES